MNNGRGTVTRDGWSVSVITGGEIEGAQLSVMRHLDPTYGARVSKYTMKPGDGNGKKFATSDDAWAYALEHGYTQRMVTPWCPFCRCLHRSTYGARPRRVGFCDVVGRSVYGVA